MLCFMNKNAFSSTSLGEAMDIKVNNVIIGEVTFLEVYENINTVLVKIDDSLYADIIMLYESDDYEYVKPAEFNERMFIDIINRYRRNV